MSSKYNYNPFMTLLFYSSLLILWQVLSSTLPVVQVLVPSPLKIIMSVKKNIWLFVEALLITSYEVLSGLMLSALAAMLCAFALDRFQPIKRLVWPLFIGWQAAPVLAVAPLMVLWFGFGISSKIIMVSSIAFFPITVSFMQALERTDRDMINLFTSYGASRAQIFRYIKLPLAGSGFFAGFKIAATYAVGSAVAAEWIGGQQGLGALLLISRRSYDYPQMFAAVCLIIFLSLLFYWSSALFERFFLKKMNLLEM